MQRAVIYCRVSTREQVENMSLPTQQKACRDYCERHGIDVDRVFVEEGESAKSADRHELQNLLQYCRTKKNHIDYLVVYSVNRFSRNNHYHHVVRHHLSQLGITLRSVTEPIDDSSSGKLMEGVLAAFAQFDNDVRAERTTEGMKAALEKGRWTHRPPLGYLKPPRAYGMPSMIEDPDRAPLVREAFALMEEGYRSISEVRDIVTSHGLRTSNGRPLTAQSLGSMLRNPLYAGVIESSKWQVRANGDFNALVSTETFDAVQRVLNRKRLTYESRERFNPDFPLRHFVRCAKCGTPLTASWSKGRTKRYPYYRCPKPGCRAVNARKQALEGAFVELLDHLQPRTEYVSLFIEIVLDVWNRRSQDQLHHRTELKVILDDLSAKKNRLVDAFLYQGTIDQQTYEEQRRLLDERRQSIEMELNEPTGEHLDIENTLDFARHALLNARPLWAELDHMRKRRFQEVLFPDGVRFDGDSIGTATTSSVFTYLSEVSIKEEGMVTPTGFEPVLSA